ncbi:signal transduction histidine kinase [Kitasatospora kifunensis]|uniref:Signal transduction histidine kinase n=2 Tax=Kitasatospora kifunensis TaxID=58351 RepID=A0A7W7R3R0_KITKI|nr:signal transduction histidine kinase [Kitasatospora kifunensis]
MAAEGDAASDVAERIAASEDEILARYRECLQQKHNPLAGNPEAWAGCRIQAQQIVAACVESLLDPAANPSVPVVSSMADLAGARIQQGMRVSNSAEAGTVLFQVVMDVLVREISGHPDALRLLAQAIHSLQQGIGLRLQIGAAEYDSFILNTVTEVNRDGYLSLARDIHDQLGNSLSLALRQMDLYEMALGDAEQALSPRLKAVRTAIHESLMMARDVVSGLRRNAREAPLLTALTAFVESMAVAETEAQVYVNGSESWAPPETLDELYVVLRECLRNSFAHSRAEKIVVRVDIAPHEINAVVADDGCGFDLDAVLDRKSINGLTGIRERIGLLDGTVAFSPTPGKGTTVKTWIPIQKEGARHGQ